MRAAAIVALVVGLGGGDEARAAARGRPAPAAAACRARREIGGDDVEPRRPQHVPAHRPRPGAEPPRRAAEQPVHLALGDADLAGASAAGRGSGASGVPRPAEQAVEIAGRGRRRCGPSTSRPTSRQRLRLDGPEIIVGDVEAADDHLAPVGQRQLLVVAQQIAASPMRAEPAEATRRRRSAAGRSRVLRGRAEAVDEQRRPSTPRPRRGDQRVAHPRPRIVVEEDVVEDAQALGGAVDQRDERLEPFRPLGEQGQPVARRPRP